MLAAQLAALDACRPGSTLPAVHDAAVQKLVEGLVSLDVLSGDVDELIKEEKHRPYYMHGTSHWLGRDVHDVGAYQEQDDAPSRMRRGCVLTVEPGLYFDKRDRKIPAALRGIGVRIEDDVLVTARGQEVLTAAVPKTVADVEAACRGEAAPRAARAKGRSRP